MKKSPKGWTTTLERDGKAKYQKGKVIEEDEQKEAEDRPAKKAKSEGKSKKKSLDELLEGGMV